MEIRGLAFLPILWSIWMLLGLSTLFAVTVILGHETHPYISATAARLPESVIYTVVFMVSSILGAGIVLLQYKFMIIRTEPSEKRHLIGQRILLAIGWISCIGSALNAVFPVNVNLTAHDIGSGLGFGCADIFNLCQAILLYKRSFSSRRMCHIRLALTSVTSVLMLFFSGVMSSFYLHLIPDNHKQVISDAGMVVEWVQMFCLVIQQLTNYTDFQHLSLRLSREGVSISLREPAQDPENP
ncbi:DNA damage-regulated autophagy modulator protein 1-like [Leptodactylus fuscus]|uniref:DNA damage-regulated autophagy modulator protein 1-like n=1 Tax=Leptodactylus fuscus TaxID=238119 RepID=UPI003F4EF1FD